MKFNKVITMLENSKRGRSGVLGLVDGMKLSDYRAFKPIDKGEIMAAAYRAKNKLEAAESIMQKYKKTQEISDAIPFVEPQYTYSGLTRTGIRNSKELGRWEAVNEKYGVNDQEIMEARFQRALNCRQGAYAIDGTTIHPCPECISNALMGEGKTLLLGENSVRYVVRQHINELLDTGGVKRKFSANSGKIWRMICAFDFAYMFGLKNEARGILVNYIMPMDKRIKRERDFYVSGDGTLRGYKRIGTVSDGYERALVDQYIVVSQNVEYDDAFKIGYMREVGKRFDDLRSPKENDLRRWEYFLAKLNKQLGIRNESGEEPK